MKRSPSLKSEVSTLSVGTNITGVSSASTMGGGQRKRVEPMFNLAAHNMLHTIVTDASTDTKVAKVS
jgi:hypothetical protein